MAKNIGEYGENKKPQMQPNCSTYGMCLPLLLNSATLPLGERKVSTDDTNVCPYGVAAGGADLLMF
jgi:hypothetical protein